MDPRPYVRFVYSALLCIYWTGWMSSPLPHVNGLSVSITSNTTTFIEDQSPALFVCNVSGLINPVYKWFIGSTRVNNGNVGTLVYAPKRRDVGVPIKCSVSGSEDKPMNATYGPLEIQYPPSSTRICAMQEGDCVDSPAPISPGDSLTVICTALDSNPESDVDLQVKDQRDGYKVLHDRNVTLERSDQTKYGWNTEASAEIQPECGPCVVVVVECRVVFLENISYRKEQLWIYVQQQTVLPTRESTESPVISWITPTISSCIALVVVFVVVFLWCIIAKRRGRRDEHRVTKRQAVDMRLSTDMISTPQRLDHPQSSSRPIGTLTRPDVRPALADSKLEFPRHRLTLQAELGGGQFGEVRKAVAHGILRDGVDTTVAVKTIKGRENFSTVADFMNELQIFQSLQSHPYVVSFLGCCTRVEPFYMIMEFVPNGTLEAFLKRKRKAWSMQPPETRRGKEAVSAVRLLTFAFQVANGMEYIASKHLIHRDLAARNVLLAEGLVCKLCDFGLARDVTESNDVYSMVSGGAVPVRWLALECLLNDMYTTKSDVWSFGVLLWELVTLGAMPFPDKSTDAVIDYLKSGNRLPKPIHCGKHLYRIMTSCWNDTPKLRPTFSSLQSQLDLILKNDLEVLDMRGFQAHLQVYRYLR
ncbi:fibroblast growth factor receptor 3-like [Asterias amurensis]|uniref:fibroblast growth factor receptor 3-like n=1 Tax=Asterias amurensis TaxID=7602 RepID=UPI003AB62955